MKQQALTLEMLAKLIDEKMELRIRKILLENNQIIFDHINTKIGGVNASVDNLESKVDNLESKVDNLESKMNTRFDEIYDAIQEAMADLDEKNENKVGSLKRDLEPRIEKLEKHVFTS